ncbi:MAG: hypothetical protein HOO96_36995 [Polyangiaceae bacterium]|nr:hypothetical protein [Polyangiaceae bacterium]
MKLPPILVLLLLSTQACAPAAFSPSPAESVPREGASAPRTTSASPAPATPSDREAASSVDPPDPNAPVTPESVYAKFRADVRKCMHGEPVDGGSLAGGPTCAKLRRAAQTGDTSELPKGAADAFKEERGR